MSASVASSSLPLRANSCREQTRRDAATHASKNRMRSRPATPTASYVVSCSASSPRGGGMTALARQPSRESRICQSRLPVRHRAITNRNRCGGQQSVLLRRTGWGRRPQCPGTQLRLRAFLEYPPAIHSRESPATAGSAAIIQRAQELSRFAGPTLIQIVAPRNTKNSPPCAETVEDQSSLWKTEEN